MLFYLRDFGGLILTHETTIDAARYLMKWWNRYYHILLTIHFALGILGVLLGALIAADFQNEMFVLSPKFLGILSTVIVGIVAFVQPGRMASVFYDAYWRVRVELLRHSNKDQSSEILLQALANGFINVATIQPEALKKQLNIYDEKIDDTLLSDEQEERLEMFRQELIKEKRRAADSDPTKFMKDIS